jgi:NAD(P)H dehydrogenase (quinone)
VIAATRNPDKIADLGQRGAELRRADFEDPASLAAAFAGAERMLMISTDAIDRPGRRLQQHRNAVDVAARTGIKHIVYTSMPNPEVSPVIFAPDHLGTEQAIAASHMSYTILRDNWYTDFLVPGLTQPVASGTLYAAAGDGGAAYVTREDCAQCAAAALSGNETGKRTLNVTGPAVVTFAELAQIASDLTGKPVKYAAVTPDERKQQLVGAGLPAAIAEIMISSQVAMAKGTMGPASNDVQALTGRVPTSVQEFLSSRRAALAPQ